MCQLSLKQNNLKTEVKAIRQEIQILKSLSHPNIVQYYSTEISDDGKGVDILLEYVPGGSIRQILDKFMPFDEVFVKIYSRMILDGLFYLHENDIVHRDLKCSNILLDARGVIKLSDFGASKKIFSTFNQYGLPMESQMSKSIVGSPYWIAPEVIN